ncbi:MAG: hypothetical protein ACT4PM_03325 [Gemmatimonadales bacterium]
MFERLIESRAAGIRPGVSIAWSALLHALLAAGSIVPTHVILRSFSMPASKDSSRPNLS